MTRLLSKQFIMAKPTKIDNLEERKAQAKAFLRTVGNADASLQEDVAKLIDKVKTWYEQPSNSQLTKDLHSFIEKCAAEVGPVTQRLYIPILLKHILAVYALLPPGHREIPATIVQQPGTMEPGTWWYPRAIVLATSTQ